MKRLATFALACACVAIGLVYAQTDKQPEKDEALAPGKIRVTPVELFPGDLKRLRPHLEMEGVCFKIEYNGPKKVFLFKTEIWEHGEAKEVGIARCTVEGPSAGEASISVKKAMDDKGQSALRIVTHARQRSAFGSPGGTNFVTKAIPNDKLWNQSDQGVNALAEFDARGQIYLWCTALNGNGMPELNSAEELARSVDFAIVLKMVVQTPK